MLLMKIYSRKGSIDTVFVFILAIVVIGFILVFGVNILGPFLGTSSDAQLIVEMDRLDVDICKSSGEECRGGCYWNCPEGSGTEVDFTVPGGINRVCFFDPQEPGPNPAGNWEGDFLVEKVIKTKGYNIVPFKESIYQDLARKIPKLKPTENFCIGSGEHKLWVTNLGDRLDIEVRE